MPSGAGTNFAVWSLVVSVASFSLSLFNLWYGLTLGSRLRRDALKREEFSSTVRTPIEAALTEVMSEVANLRALSRSYRGLADIKIEVSANAEKITDKADKLFEALQRADEAEWASGTDWLACTHPHWDRFLELVDAADKPTTLHTKVVENISSAAQALRSLEAAVRARIDREVQSHIENQ